MASSAPQRPYSSEEDKQILQGIVLQKLSCKQLGQLLGRDRRSVNKRFKILVSRGQKQKAQIQSETAGAALSLAADPEMKTKKPARRLPWWHANRSASWASRPMASPFWNASPHPKLHLLHRLPHLPYRE